MGWLQRCRRTKDHRASFRRRNHLLAEMSRWEILDLLIENTWQLRPMPRNIEPVPVKINKHRRAVGVLCFSASFEFDQYYLQARASTRELTKFGHIEIKQKQLVNYYKGLIGERQRGTANSFIDDSMALTDPAPQLALADVDEQTVGNDNVVAKKRQFRIEYNDTFYFGRFHFQHQVYEFETHEEHRWKVFCPYHKDACKLKVPCTRSKNIDLENQEPVLRQLRQWCLVGRGCSSRAKPKHCSHKAIKFSQLIM